MTSASRDETYFVHRATGTLVYDQSKGRKADQPWWARLKVDGEIAGYYAWLAKTWGMPLMKGNANGFHVTVVRGEPPPLPERWGLGDGEEVEFWYSHCMRWTPYHAWVDVYSDRLFQVRAELGYPPKLQKRLDDGRVFSQSFHLTVGRRI